MFDTNNPYQNPNFGSYVQPEYSGTPNNYNRRPNTGVRNPNINLDWIRVNNIEEIKNFNVRPGSQVWFMFQEEPIFAVKTCNEIGLANTEFYKFEPIDINNTNKNNINNIHIELVEALNSKVLEMQGKIEGLTKEVSKLKGGKANGKSSNVDNESGK